MKILNGILPLLGTLIAATLGSCGPDQCYDSVRVCGYTVGPFAAQRVSSGGGCGGPRVEYIRYEGHGMVCDTQGNCEAHIKPFDLRLAGYDARGSIAITASFGAGVADVTARHHCVGEDCELVSSLIGQRECDDSEHVRDECGEAGYQWDTSDNIVSDSAIDSAVDSARPDSGGAVTDDSDTSAETDTP
jgi:hypothetical protein